MKRRRRSLPPNVMFAVQGSGTSMCSICFPVLVEDGDAAAREKDIALVVECHAIRTQLAEKAFVLQRAIGLDFVGIGSACANVGDVKNIAVGSADDAVGLLEVGGDALEILAVSGEEIHMLAILLHRRIALPIGAFVKRIGKINSAVVPNPKVIGAVE